MSERSAAIVRVLGLPDAALWFQKQPHLSRPIVYDLEHLLSVELTRARAETSASLRAHRELVGCFTESRKLRRTRREGAIVVTSFLPRKCLVCPDRFSLADFYEAHLRGKSWTADAWARYVAGWIIAHLNFDDSQEPSESQQQKTMRSEYADAVLAGFEGHRKEAQDKRLKRRSSLPEFEGDDFTEDEGHFYYRAATPLSESAEQTIRRLTLEAIPKAQAYRTLLEHFGSFAELDRIATLTEDTSRKRASRLPKENAERLRAAWALIGAALRQESTRLSTSSGRSDVRRPMPDELLPREYRERKSDAWAFRQNGLTITSAARVEMKKVRSAVLDGEPRDAPWTMLRDGGLRSEGLPYDHCWGTSHNQAAANSSFEDTDLLSGVDSSAKRPGVVVVTSMSRPGCKDVHTYYLAAKGGDMKQNGHKSPRWTVWTFECFPEGRRELWYAARNGAGTIYAPTQERLLEKARRKQVTRS